MYRDDGEVSVSSTLFLAAFAFAKRFASSLSSFSVTASSMIVARSPSGTDERMRSRSRTSLSQSSALAVNWTLQRSGAMGCTTGGVVRAGAGRDDAIASRSGFTCLDSELRPTRSGPSSISMGGVFFRCSGNLRSVAGTSGLGESSATNSSITSYASMQNAEESCQEKMILFCYSGLDPTNSKEVGHRGRAMPARMLAESRRNWTTHTTTTE